MLQSKPSLTRAMLSPCMADGWAAVNNRAHKQVTSMGSKSGTRSSATLRTMDEANKPSSAPIYVFRVSH